MWCTVHCIWIISFWKSLFLNSTEYFFLFSHFTNKINKWSIQINHMVVQSNLLNVTKKITSTNFIIVEDWDGLRIYNISPLTNLTCCVLDNSQRRWLWTHLHLHVNLFSQQLLSIIFICGRSQTSPTNTLCIVSR